MGTWFRVLVSRLNGWLRARSLESDFDAELQAHIALRYE
jgi:hypothetical protein